MTAIVKTTGLAGGLLCPYKGLFAACARRRLMVLPTALPFQANPKGLFYCHLTPARSLGLFMIALFSSFPLRDYFLLFCTGSPVRVYIFIQCHLIRFVIFFQLICNIFLYLLCIFSYCINIISSAPKMSVSIFIFQICMSFKCRELDEHLRFRLRMCIWKQWKKVKTRFNNLMQLGIKRKEAWKWANKRKGYARVARSQILHIALTNERLKKFVLVSLLDQYQKVHI